MGTQIATAERSSTKNEQEGYPVTVQLRNDHAILTIEEAEALIKQLKETIAEVGAAQ